MARLFTLPMPEAGSEREVYWMVHHNCDQAKALKRVVGEDCDLIQFSVGLVGAEMPAGVAFEVVSTNNCEACGKTLRAWFQWSAPKFWLPA